MSNIIARKFTLYLWCSRLTRHLSILSQGYIAQRSMCFSYEKETFELRRLHKLPVLVLKILEYV